MKNIEPFGKKILLFAGDFRQLLPVVANGSRADIVNASIKRLSFWSSFTQLQLTQNMRAHEDLEYAKWVLKVGDGSANAKQQDVVELPIQCIVDKAIEDYVFGTLIDV